MATTATTAQREIPFAILNRGDSDQTFSNQMKSDLHSATTFSSTALL